MSSGIKRVSTEVFGDILRSPEGSIFRSGILIENTVDAGNTPQTQIRAGLVLAQRNDGYWQPWNLEVSQHTESDSAFTANTVVVIDLGTPFLPGYLSIESTDTVTVVQTNWVDGSIAVHTVAGDADVTVNYIANPRDGTEVPLGILLDPVRMTDMEGNVKKTQCRILLAGWIKDDSVIFASEALETLGKHWLASHGFMGFDISIL